MPPTNRLLGPLFRPLARRGLVRTPPHRAISSSAPGRMRIDDDGWEEELRRRRERLSAARPLVGGERRAAQGRGGYGEEHQLSQDGQQQWRRHPEDVSDDGGQEGSSREKQRQLEEQLHRLQQMQHQLNEQLQQHQHERYIRQKKQKRQQEQHHYKAQIVEDYEAAGGGGSGSAGAGVAAGGFAARFPRGSKLGFWIVWTACGVVFFYMNLETVPVSGRRRFNWVPEEWMREASEDEFPGTLQELTSEFGLVPSRDDRTRMVNKVLARLLAASGHDTTFDQWTVYVLDAPDHVNAMVTPHRAMVIFSGLFRIATSEAELAAVLSHELGHYIAGHASEQQSNRYTLGAFLVGLVALAAAQRRWLRVGALIALGGTALELWGDKPLKRQHETEADLVGMLLMADACYDPRATAGWWKKLMIISTKQEPEFVSTHPPHEKRLRRVLEAMPVAMKRFEDSDCEHMMAFAREVARRKLAMGGRQPGGVLGAVVV